LKPIRDRAKDFSEHPEDVRRILDDGAATAREVAQETLEQVRASMGLNYK
jgi:tryptophanyl-tRNA synthetase